MHRISALILLLLSSFSLFSQQVEKVTASDVAMEFFKERILLHHPERNVSCSVKSQLEIKPEGNSIIYVINLNPEGFVLVSPSSGTFPVLGYSMKGCYTGENVPESLNAWLRYYSRQIEHATTTRTTTPEISAAWLKLTTGSGNETANLQSRLVEPLLRTTWDQGNYYNAMCPPDAGGPGGHCWAGCVATAVGQLMFYHRWPDQGTGEYSYTHPVYGEQYANFGETTYEWNGMETTLYGPNSHIALLLYQLGVSFDMDYGPNGSGMWNHSAANSMRNYFKYGPQTQYIFRDTTTMNWDSILIANLDARKPLYYAGWEGVGSPNGHAFVCDGYAPDNFYHFNWGWSSSYDGYFLLTALNPGGSNFNFAQEVIKDIYPDTLTCNYPQFCNGPDTLPFIAGSFSDGSNMVNYHNNADCFWLIQPDEPDFDSITSVNIDFPLLDLNTGDRIRIYQGADTTGTLLAEFTGNDTPPTLVVPHHAALVRFTSDSGLNAGGFLASFKSILPVYCTGTTTYNEASGVFEDGSGDKLYNNSAICKWKIIPDELVPMKLIVESFSTEPENDELRIYDLGTQQLIASLSGDTIPPPILVPGGKAYLMFITNKEITGEGWTIRWEPADPTGLPDLQDNIRKIYPIPAQETLFVECRKSLNEGIMLYTVDANGRISRPPFTFSGSTIRLDTGNLHPGLYLLRITDGEMQMSGKFLKE